MKNTEKQYRPLADRIRPNSWKSFEGLDGLDNSLIRKLQKKDFIPPSLILWGPPGTGKTSFAKLIKSITSFPFKDFSALMGGVKEIREIVKEAKSFYLPTILFVDEIHRFSKAQQDSFLPHIEDGTIILIGATTENPSFYLNAALLSRTKVLVFNSLNFNSLENILGLAEQELQISISAEAKRILINSCGGDARKMLNLLEEVSNLLTPEEKNLDDNKLKSYLRNQHNLYYDRSGDEHYNLISAFIKSLRGSSADAALYYGLRIIESGEDPRFLIRRMIIFASEDIGNADPRALTLATSTLEAYNFVGLPEGKIPISQCITYLATAPKSNRSYEAMNKVIEEIKNNPKISVPIHLRNAPTKLMANLDYGKEYQYPHNYDQAYVAGVDYLPKELINKIFYTPSNRGYEKNINERIDWLKSLKKD